MTNVKINYKKEIPDVLEGMQAIHNILEKYFFDASILHLVYLRASQINGCGHCVEMHTREARSDGEVNKRLDNLVVWDQVSDYSEREKLAFAWTEALTCLDDRKNIALIREKLSKHFTEKEIGILTANVAMINFGIEFRSQQVESR